MSCRGLLVTHTEGAARASRGHERLGGVQPLRALGLEEVVDDGVEEGACARSGVQVGCWGQGCWGQGGLGRALSAESRRAPGARASPGRANPGRKPGAGRGPGGPGRLSYAGHLKTGGDAANGHGAAEHLEGRHALAWLGLKVEVGVGVGLGLGLGPGLGSG